MKSRTRHQPYHRIKHLLPSSINNILFGEKLRGYLCRGAKNKLFDDDSAVRNSVLYIRGALNGGVSVTTGIFALLPK